MWRDVEDGPSLADVHGRVLQGVPEDSLVTNERVTAPLAAELMQLVTSAPMSAGTRNKLQAIALRVAAVEREHTKLAQIGGAALRELHASADEPSPVHSEEWLRIHRCPPDVECAHCNPEKSKR